MSELTGTKASGGIPAVPGTGLEFFYSAQLIGSSLIKTGNIAIVGARYSDTSTADTVSLNLNIRYPVIREWRINPRVQADYRQSKLTNVDELRLRPSLTMDYYFKRRVRLEVAGGVDWSPDLFSDRTDDGFDFFLTLGYRVDF